MEAVDTLFPASERVVYLRSPLQRVICQYRFPTVLRIEAELPVEFQERVRAEFPLFGRVTFPNQMSLFPAEMAPLFGAGQANNGYHFTTTDGATSLTLGQDSIGLSTTSYTTWEQFEPSFRKAVHALVTIYKPSFFGRIGLRYSNRISRTALGLQSESWSNLLQEHILGEIALPVWQANLVSAQRVTRVTTPGGDGSVLFQHGLAGDESGSGADYVLDFDFFTDKNTKVEDAADLLERFHKRAGRAFRWCISERLHRAMGPRVVNDDGIRLEL